MQPLSGLLVLDFTTLLPGPLATLVLAEAGAEVVKIERPDGGDPLRGGQGSAPFAQLNRGKRSVAVDLKDPGALRRLRPLIERADVLVEQFRPGVMDRLGLGYAELRAVNPGLVYCSITGYGQDGPRAGEAGHDLNYMAATGVLALGAGAAGEPCVPPVLAADVAGGSWPAVIDVLLALRLRERNGEGCHLDVSMSHNLFPFAFWAIAGAEATGHWPRPGAELLTGGSPRYRLYPTADRRFLAVAALEQRFWDRFCACIDLAPALRDDAADPAATGAAVADIVGGRSSEHWRERFAGEDACCTVVATLREALADPQFRARGALERRRVDLDGTRSVSALRVPISETFLAGPDVRGWPDLGEANATLLAAAGEGD